MLGIKHSGYSGNFLNGEETEIVELHVMLGEGFKLEEPHPILTLSRGDGD